jgi:dTMP kinase
MTARLIAIEGLDGSGKETQTKLLRQFLEAQGAKVGSISFPQYGEPSAALVED